MSVLALIIAVALLGLVGWAANRAPFIAGWAKTAINCVLVLIVVLLILDALGLLAELRGIQVPHV